MKSIFQKNLQFGDISPRNRQKIAQIEYLDHFLDFASLVFPDFAHNDRWACQVVFLQFAGPVDEFLFSLIVSYKKLQRLYFALSISHICLHFKMCFSPFPTVHDFKFPRHFDITIFVRFNSRGFFFKSRIKIVTTFATFSSLESSLNIILL